MSSNRLSQGDGEIVEPNEDIPIASADDLNIEISNDNLQDDFHPRQNTYHEVLPTDEQKETLER